MFLVNSPVTLTCNLRFCRQGLRSRDVSSHTFTTAQFLPLRKKESSRGLHDLIHELDDLVLLHGGPFGDPNIIINTYGAEITRWVHNMTFRATSYTPLFHRMLLVNSPVTHTENLQICGQGLCNVHVRSLSPWLNSFRCTREI